MPQCQMTRDKEEVSLSRVILALAIATVAAPVVGHAAVASPLRVPQSSRTVASPDTIPVRPKPVSLDSVRVIAVWNASVMSSGLTAAGGRYRIRPGARSAPSSTSRSSWSSATCSLDARARCVDLEERPVPDCVKQHLALSRRTWSSRGWRPSRRRLVPANAWPGAIPPRTNQRVRLDLE